MHTIPSRLLTKYCKNQSQNLAKPVPCRLKKNAQTIRLKKPIKYVLYTLLLSDFRHHYSSQDEDEFIVPYKALKLFTGGKFDKDYNTRYRPIEFSVPTTTERVKLVATITGHGSDNYGCAEFCVTSHHFTINGKSNVRVFKNAATSMGCASRVERGVVPNEHGTWLYGRDGWCPGQDVVPWVVDVTDQIHRDNGALNTVTYYGWFNGTDPHPIKNPGEILMTSYLIFYVSSDDLDKDVFYSS